MADSPLNRTSTNRARLFCVAATALISFAVSLGGTWIYDDHYILGLDHRYNDPAHWHRFWTEPYNDGVDNLYRPLTSSTYLIQVLIHGKIAWPFHLVNILLHAVVSCMVARLGEKLSGKTVGFVAGLLFAVHPIHTEAVANIVGRAELLCALGTLAAMLALLRQPFRKTDAGLAAAWFVVALLSKEQGMITPLLLVIVFAAARFGAVANQPTPQERFNLKLCVLMIVPVLAGYIFLRENVLGLKFWWDRSMLDWTINPLIRSDADRFSMPLVLLGRYVGLLVFPYKLLPDYGANIIGWQVRWNEPWFYIGCVAVLGWITILFFSIRRRDWFAVAMLLCLAITYGVVGNIITLIGTNFGERLMYLPSVFFLLLVATWIAKLPARPLWTLTAIVLLSGGVRTISYAWQWNDPLRFYSYCVRQEPRSLRMQMQIVSLHHRRAEEIMKPYMMEAQEELRLARRASETARQIMPDYPDAWIQAALVEMTAGDFVAAEKHLNEAMRLHPSARIDAWMRHLAVRRAATNPS